MRHPHERAQAGLERTQSSTANTGVQAGPGSQPRNDVGQFHVSVVRERPTAVPEESK